MDRTIYTIKFVDSIPLQFDKNTLYVQKFAEDIMGTTSGAAWVRVFNENHEKKVALFKPMDYDEPLGAYAELLYSRLASLCFPNIQIRIPSIHLVNHNNELGILSYSVVNKPIEELFHIDSLMFYKYERKHLRIFYTLSIDDILECIHHEVCDTKNFMKIQKAVIFAVLLDAFTNNADRHGLNWGLVRNMQTNYYVLALFDNTKSFVNMFFNRVGYKNNALWTLNHNGTISSSHLETGDELVEFIKGNYPAYFYEFMAILESVIETFISDISAITTIDTPRIAAHLRNKITLTK